MNQSEIKELLSLFESGTIREFDLKTADVSFYLSKNNGPKIQSDETQLVTESVTAASAEQTKNDAVDTLNESAESIDGETINSPIVGVVYTAPNPTTGAFVTIGDTVEVGDTLCIVEAMKIMNDITSDVSGTVTEILIKNEDIVEFGQPLFRIS
ncbi:MAG: acetyl-CoA carboxylase biotin carboxyl carrier protein [Vagococcus sp.]